MRRCSSLPLVMAASSREPRSLPYVPVMAQRAPPAGAGAGQGRERRGSRPSLRSLAAGRGPRLLPRAGACAATGAGRPCEHAAGCSVAADCACGCFRGRAAAARPPGAARVDYMELHAITCYYMLAHYTQLHAHYTPLHACNGHVMGM